MSFAQYLAELKNVRVLSPLEEVRLWHGYKEEGDVECRRRLIESYQPLVFKAVMGVTSPESIRLDSVQEGTVGLIEAVEQFDHTRGVAFSLYAMHRIRGRILNFLGKEGKRDIAYIDSPIAGDEDNGTMRDLLVDPAPAIAGQLEHNILLEQIRKALERLPEKEQTVLTGVYMNDCEPKQLAEALNMSVSHIYRLQKQGIRRIRGMLSRFMHHW